MMAADGRLVVIARPPFEAGIRIGSPLTDLYDLAMASSPVTLPTAVLGILVLVMWRRRLLP